MEKVISELMKQKAPELVGNCCSALSDLDSLVFERNSLFVVLISKREKKRECMYVYTTCTWSRSHV